MKNLILYFHTVLCAALSFQLPELLRDTFSPRSAKRILVARFCRGFCHFLYVVSFLRSSSSRRTFAQIDGTRNTSVVFALDDGQRRKERKRKKDRETDRKREDRNDAKPPRYSWHPPRFLVKGAAQCRRVDSEVRASVRRALLRTIKY